MSMKDRVEFIDLAKGICILFVVLLHVFGDTSGELIRVMNLFRMPLYFVLSGLFFKSYGGLYSFLKKKTNKLLMPFLFSFFGVSVPSTLFLNAFNGVKSPVIKLFFEDNGDFNLGINGASWFLLCLFFINLYFYVVQSMCRGNIYGISFFSLISGFIGYGMCIKGLDLPLWIDSSLTAMPFFTIGYIIRCYSNILYERFSLKYYVYFIISFVVLIVVYAIDEYLCSEVIAYGENKYDIPPYSLYLGGISGTLCVMFFSKYYRKVPILSYLGRYSIVVLLTHLIYLFIIRNCLYQLHISQHSAWINIGVFVFIIIISLPTIKFCIRWLPYFFAQKDLWK